MQFCLYVLLVSLHLTCMNVAGGAPVVSAWLEWRERRGGRVVTAATDYLAAAALYALLVGALLGTALVALRWSPAFVELWTGPLARKLYWGLGELGFSLVLAVSYLAWRKLSPQPGAITRLTRALLPLLSGTNLLYHFPVLFVVAGQLAEQGHATGPSLTASEFRQRMVAGVAPAMSLHVIVASFAAAGITLFGLVLRWQRQGRPAGEIQSLGTGAAQLALIPTVLQILVGLWVLVQIDAATQNRLLGGSPAVGLCFVAGVVAALWLMQQLAAIAFGETQRSLLIQAMAGFLATVLLMTAAWHMARLG